MMGVLFRWITQKSRVWKYQLLSTCKRVEGHYSAHQPVLLEGLGVIHFEAGVEFGVKASPEFFTKYCYIEARFPTSRVAIGAGTRINNGFSAVAFSSIQIGEHCLIGCDCSIIDTDGHDLSPSKRHAEFSEGKAIRIGNNVFIGDRVVILKGVTVGANAVIGSGAVVTEDVPENTIVAGNPAKVIRCL